MLGFINGLYNSMDKPKDGHVLMVNTTQWSLDPRKGRCINA